MNPVEEYILNNKGPQKELLEFLHQHLVKRNLQARIAYGLPFYYGKRWVCYLKTNKDGSLDLSFTRANQFEDPTGLLDSRGRRQISSLCLWPDQDLPMEAIDTILDAALELDQEKKA